MAAWKMSTDKLSPGTLYGEDKVKGQMFSHKYGGFELMQNCDLPPPLKVFTGTKKTIPILSPMSRVYSMISQEDEGREMEMSDNSSEREEKLELLKALRLSQTRAREAEKKLEALLKEKDALSKFLLQESLQLFAYKKWVKLMELQVSKLEKQGQKQEQGYCRRSIWDAIVAEDEDVPKGSRNMTWLVAVALCLGIAGFGFAFGYRYIF